MTLIIAFVGLTEIKFSPAKTTITFTILKYTDNIDVNYLTNLSSDIYNPYN